MNSRRKFFKGLLGLLAFGVAAKTVSSSPWIDLKPTKVAIANTDYTGPGEMGKYFKWIQATYFRCKGGGKVVYRDESGRVILTEYLYDTEVQT